jgi:predicted transposase YbfD/YdcC
MLVFWGEVGSRGEKGCYNVAIPLLRRLVMTAGPALRLVDHFAELTDPRVERTRRHEAADILAIAVCAIISGCDDWLAVAAYGRAKYDWLKTFLCLPNGIPSHDTFNRFFNLLDPEAFRACFVSWVGALHRALGLRHVPIDGKALRGSFDKAAGKSALHLVSAWSRENGLTLGQVAVEDKSNEITAIPRLLDILDLSGALVSIDAVGCQKEIAADIRRGGGDYVLAVKDNQPRLHEDVQACVERALEGDLDDGCLHHSEEKGHGRIERRYACVVEDLDGIRDRELWRDVRTVWQMVRERVVGDGEPSVETHYYLSSRVLTAQEFAEVIRGHWSIENNCHWTLDVAFGEDACRCRTGHGDENLAWLRRMALSLLKQDKTAKVGIKTKRMKAGWENIFSSKSWAPAYPNKMRLPWARTAVRRWYTRRSRVPFRRRSISFFCSAVKSIGFIAVFFADRSCPSGGRALPHRRILSVGFPSATV